MNGDRPAGAVPAGATPGAVLVADVAVRRPAGDGTRRIRIGRRTAAAVRSEGPRPWRPSGSRVLCTNRNLLEMSQTWTVLREGSPP